MTIFTKTVFHALKQIDVDNILEGNADAFPICYDNNWENFHFISSSARKMRL